jgi:hypothetical protein
MAQYLLCGTFCETYLVWVVIIIMGCHIFLPFEPASTDCPPLTSLLMLLINQETIVKRLSRTMKDNL